MTVVEVPRSNGQDKRPLFPDQVQAVQRAAKHLRRPGSRGLLVAATGTGKTLVSVRVADELDARLVLFVVPTLDLAAQTALAWRRDGHGEHMVIVSSMDAAGREDLVAARVGSTSNAPALAALLSVVGKGADQVPAVTVICTYDSLDKIEQTQKTQYTVPPFDLAIMDEAHRIAGRADKKWAAVHDATRIHADRRLYMTATPRIFGSPELAESANTTRPRRRRWTGTEADLDASANSMDNEAVYGKKIFEYPLASAVADGRAADYRIVVPTLADADLRTRLNLPTPGTTGDDGIKGEAQEALRTTALHLAVLKAMTEHRLRRVLVYFTLVSDARRFARELPHTLRMLRRTAPELCPDITPQLFFAHGEHTPAQRQDIFDDFAAASCAIMTNARLISEGVDIPSVDAVVFADPTRSVIRCVQALGRALRLDVSGKVASLIVPVYVPPGADPDDILGTAYEPVWAIATALASHDHRILERLPDKANRLPKETSEVIERRWHFDFTVHPERIARAMDLASFDPRDAAASRSRRLGLAAAQAYRDEHGHLDVPAGYTDPAGYTLGTFITTMRDARTAGRLDADWIAELDALNMIWDKHDAAWRARLTMAADYHAAHAHLASPATTKVGAWLAEQRHLATKGQLDPARAADLAALDPHWRLPHGADWHRKYHLLHGHLAAGHDPSALTRHTLLGTAKIGSWLHRQLTTWHTLHPGQQRLLSGLGLTPDTNPLAPTRRTRRTFAQTVQLLELFLHREGRAPTARETIRVDGETVSIGAWLAKARTKHRAGQLPDEHVRLAAALFDGDWTEDTAAPAIPA
ncbi:DEAD/DEAH box helicase [Streptomyces platensis]|uniref:DEAD/DEAH box helicase n=1 Tax=Streptomyces platensis TaxID=58346 RepID=A0AAE6NNR6_STRPT|nr:DEAD/DEAH box helicase [Streptomyces platensis]OSY35798.1 UvrABC system protein B [Streptomyces platensis]QEV50295.1 DEAD/DEAH box helicase [Streptomyces platensis]QEV56514.1 DEAD/DEAH box helicase [Streptomyces platensis]